MKPTLHLLMGLPGSGKTTFSKYLQQITGAVRLTSDEQRLKIFPEPTFSKQEHDNLYGILDHNVMHLLAAGMDVIYDANLNRKIHRDEKYKLAKDHDAKVILWFVDAPLNIAKNRRINEQNHQLVPTREKPSTMFDRIADIIELPGNDEEFQLINGQKITKKYVKEQLDKINNLNSITKINS